MDVVERRLLAMAAAHCVVSVEQLAYRASSQPDKDSFPLLERLLGDGLLRQMRWVLCGEGLVCVTAAGLDAIRSRLSPPGPLLADGRGELGRVQVWLAAWDGAFGEMTRVLSRRELEGLDRAAAERAGAGTGFAVSVAGETLFPDVAMETRGGHRVAVYLSLWPNRMFDLEVVFGAHQAAGNVDGLMLVTDGDEAFRGRCRAVAERLGVSGLVRIRRARTGVRNLPAGYT